MIPLSIPHLSGNEWKYVKDCLDTGWISSVGGYVTQFEDLVAQYTGAKYGVACMNGTAALHIAQILLEIKTGDHIIVPNLTFVATLNAIKYTRASPILIDIDPDTWQMDLDLLEAYLEENTYLVTSGYGSHEETNYHSLITHRPIKAIMPVHILGNMGDMERLQKIAQKYLLEIIEDSTEALGSTYNEQHAGTLGRIGTFSFNGNKIISTGGGGVLTTDNENLAKRAKHLTTTAKASSLEYFHDETGYNYRLVNILAAVGVAQMEQLPDYITQKKKINAYYREHLTGVGDIRFQKILAGVDPNCWLFTFRTHRMRALLEYLNKNEIQSRPFWVPMNRLPMHQNEIYLSQYDHSHQVYESAISIPSSVGLTEDQLEQVVERVIEFFGTTKNTKNH